MRIAQWGITVMIAAGSVIFYARRAIREDLLSTKSLALGANTDQDISDRNGFYGNFGYCVQYIVGAGISSLSLVLFRDRLFAEVVRARYGRRKGGQAAYVVNRIIM